MISPVLTAVLLVSTSLAPAPSESRAPKPSEGEAALTIAGEPISVEHFTRWLVRFRGENLAIDYVEAWLLKEEAKRLGVTLHPSSVSDEAQSIIDERVTEIFGGDRSLWRQELENENRTPLGFTLELEQRTRNQQLSSRILQKERRITEETLREAWVYYYGREGRTIEALVLEVEPDRVVAPPAATLTDIQAAREHAIETAWKRAVSIRKEIVESGDFAASARRHSTHASARRGGAPLNGFTPGEWSNDVLDVLAELPSGQLTEPILGMGSWWIFRIDDVRQTSFESVRSTLEESILSAPPTQAEHGALLGRLLDASTWEVQPAMWAQGPMADDDVVLKINGQSIRRDTYSDWLRIRNGEVIAPRFVEAWIIEKKAAELDIKISNEEIHERIRKEIDRRVKGSTAHTVEEWLALKSGSPSEASVVRDMLITHVAVFLAEDILKSSRVITEDLIRQRWEASYGQGGMTRTVRLIRLQVMANKLQRGASDEELARVEKSHKEKLALSELIYEKLDNGEDFGALARKYSDDESKIHGGELLNAYRPDKWPTDVEDALKKIKVGEVTEPIQVDTSLCIFELLKVAVTPLEKVREAIIDELTNEPPSIPAIANMRNVLTRDVPFTVEPGLVKS